MSDDVVVLELGPDELPTWLNDLVVIIPQAVPLNDHDDHDDKLIEEK